MMVNDKILVVSGMLSFDDYRGQLSIRVDKVVEFEQARMNNASHLVLKIDEESLLRSDDGPESIVNELESTLAAFKGGSCPIQLHYRRQGGYGLFWLGSNWKVALRDELLRRLRRVSGINCVEVVYRKNLPRD